MKIILRFCLFILTVSFVVDSAAQEVQVKGTVKDRADDSGIPGVNIVVLAKDKTIIRGQVSTLDGTFDILAPTGSSIRATYIGFDTVYYQVTAKPASNLVLYLKERTQDIEEVVIVGYQVKKVTEVSASVSVIETKDLVVTPVSNVMELIQGRVAGLNVQMNNGLPGMTGTYTIRGVSDINISGGELIPSRPLFVVDDIPQDDVGDFDMQGLVSGSGVSPLSFIPVEDIDNIQILRDAAATSLYGSKGAYGVVLINTKKGNSPKPQIDYSASFKVNTPPRLRDVVVGQAERMARINQIMRNDTSYYHAQMLVNSNPFLADSLNAYWNNNTDWQDVFYRVTFNQTHNLNFSGGDKKFNYKVNGGVYNEKGIIQNTDFNTYTLRTGMGYKPNDRFSITTSVNVGIALSKTGNGSILEQRGVAAGANTTSLLPPPSLYTSSSDILGALAVDDNKTSINYNATVSMEYQLPWKQSLKGTFGYTYATQEVETFTPGMLNNYEAMMYGYSTNSSNLYARFNTGYTYQLFLFRIGLNVGAEITSSSSSGNTVRLQGLAGDQILGPIGYRQNVSSGTANSSAESVAVMFTFNPTIGFGGKTTIGNEKYVITPAINPETNSTYGSKTKWSLNPLLGFRWNLHLEPFMKPLKDIVTAGAIRLTWGQTTRYNASIYDIWGSYLLNSGTYGGYAYIPPDLSRLPNDQLKPVTNTQWNLGYDLNLLRHKFTMNVDMYYKQIDNQLNSTNIADHNAYNTFRTTEISLVNYGMEVAIGSRPLSSESDFNLYIGLNMTINRDVTARLPNNARQITNGDVVNRVGSNTLANYLYVYKGVYANDEDVPVDPATGRRLRIGGNNSDEAYFRAGDPIWVDINGDYIIDENDKVVIGNSQPRINGGANFTLSYKNFRLSTNMSYIIRRDIINAALADRFATYADPLSQKALVPISAYNFWTPENRVADYPNPHDFTRSRIINPFRYDQTLFMEDGSYLKINNASLSYALPKKWLNKIKIRQITVTGSVNNIWTFSNYSGINPENVNSLGYDLSGGYPNARNWAFGTQILF